MPWVIKHLSFLKEKLTWLLSSPWILGLFLFILLAHLFRPPFSPYKLRLLSSQTLEKNVTAGYCDLDGNGNSEYIRLSNYKTLQANAYIYDLQGNFKDVWNIEGLWPGSPSPFFEDADHDGYSEMYVFTLVHGDSLFLNINEIMAEGRTYSRHFIARLLPYKGHLDYSIKPLCLEDINGNPGPEFIFLVNGGFSLQPRCIYAFDILNDSLYRSPISASSLFSVADFPMQHANGDETREIFLTSIATDNYGQSNNLPFSDSLSWLMVLTRNLDFLFTPVPMGGRQSICSVVPSGNEEYPFISLIINPREEGGPSVMCLHDSRGKIARNRELQLAKGKSHSFKIGNGQVFHLVQDPQGLRIEKIDGDLNGISEIFLPGISNFQFLDTDLDGREEGVGVSRFSNELVIYRENWKKPAKLRLDPGIQSLVSLSIVHAGNEQPGFAAITPENVFRLHYSRDPLYMLNFAAIISLYLLSVLLFQGLLSLLKARLLKQQAREQELLQLQLQNTMNRLDPHFVFNAINAVGSAVLSSEKEKAYEYFTRIAGLIRESLKNAFKPSKSLEEELEFVRKYLEVESIRFPGKFNWSITIDSATDLNQQVPKMLVQLFVENSIKHGLFRQQSPGVIDIAVKPEPPGTLITIADNGVGISATRNNTNTTDQKGHGLEIMERYLELFRRQSGKEIRYCMKDRREEGQGHSGTVVEVWME